MAEPFELPAEVASVFARSRWRGLGTATAAAMGLAYAMGARGADLQASPMGRSVYARTGFREVGAYGLLVDEAPEAKMQKTHRIGP